MQAVKCLLNELMVFKNFFKAPVKYDVAKISIFQPQDFELHYMLAERNVLTTNTPVVFWKVVMGTKKIGFSMKISWKYERVIVKARINKSEYIVFSIIRHVSKEFWLVPVFQLKLTDIISCDGNPRLQSCNSMTDVDFESETDLFLFHDFTGSTVLTERFGAPMLFFSHLYSSS